MVSQQKNNLEIFSETMSISVMAACPAGFSGQFGQASPRHPD